MSHFMRDFEGRRVTASAIIVAAFGSASLNVWGAYQIFPNPVTGAIVATVICACEVIAALALRHIVTDFQNHREHKALLASLIFVMAVAGCVFSGKQAFHVLFLEADANHKALEIRSTARQAEADAYHTQMLTGALTEAGVNPDHQQRRWELRQERADEANLAVLKAKPPHQAIVFILLALFETVKIGGLFALATPSTKGRTRSQRRADKRKQEIADAKSQVAHEARLRELDDSNVVPMSA